MVNKNLNLAVILKHLDLQNFETYEAFRQNEADRKEFDRLLSYVLPIWMSGSDSGRDQIALLIEFNRHINLSWQELAGHPELRAKVLATIGLGRTVHHAFHYRAVRTSPTELTDLLTRRYPDIRTEEIRVWCLQNSQSNLLELCADYGLQSKERDTIIEEYHKILL